MPVSVLDHATWQERESAHQERADGLTAAHRERAARGEKHPVWDFLFTYYSYAPSQLRRWHPGAGVQLDGAGERLGWRWYSPGSVQGSAGNPQTVNTGSPWLFPSTRAGHHLHPGTLSIRLKVLGIDAQRARNATPVIFPQGAFGPMLTGLLRSRSPPRCCSSI